LREQTHNRERGEFGLHLKCICQKSTGTAHSADGKTVNECKNEKIRLKEKKSPKCITDQGAKKRLTGVRIESKKHLGKPIENAKPQKVLTGSKEGRLPLNGV